MSKIAVAAIMLLSAIPALPSLASGKIKLSTLYDFVGGTDGAQPYGTLLYQNGLVYGTTGYGGKKACKSGCGTVFTVKPSTGEETIVYSFAGGSDGSYPLGALVPSGGALLSTTANGGGTGCGGSGCGTVFSLDPSSGKETVLHRFLGGADGASPGSGSLINIVGIFYGATAAGGGAGCDGNGCGTVFKIDPTTGTTTIVYAFNGGTDGEAPSDALINQSGALYGTTLKGGTGGYGTVFKVIVKTGKETVLHSFSGGNDGVNPGAGGLLKVGAFLYGVTSEGGSAGCDGMGCGTVYKLNPKTGAESVLYNFDAAGDGYLPAGGLIKVGGFLYGTTYLGTKGAYGTIFKVSVASGVEKLLYKFDGQDGEGPYSPLIYQNGVFFGTTVSGPTGVGTVYSFTQ